jgi:hypothetical protein
VKEVVSHEGADAQEGSATEAKVPESKQGTSPVISIAAKLNTSKSPVEDPVFTVAVAAQSKSSNKSSDATVLMSVQANKSSDGSAEQSVEENKSSDGSAEGSVEKNNSSDATNDDDATVPQREVSQPLSVDQMVLDYKRKIAVVAAERKSLDGTGEGSVGDNKSSDATVLISVEEVEPVEESKSDGLAEGSVEENQSSDASAVESVKESKSMDGTAKESVEESKSSDGSAERSVKPAIVSLSALSVMSPSAGLKVDEYQSATQYSPNQGPFREKNRVRTRSTTSPDPKKKQSSASPVTNESLKHSGRPYVFTSIPNLILTMPTILCMISASCTQSNQQREALSRKTRTRKIVNQTRPRNRSKLEVHPPSRRRNVPTKW